MGCAGQTNAVQKLNPPMLQLHEPSFFTSSSGQLAVYGPTVVGSRGLALNTAASVHRIFHALGIPTEVSCREVGWNGTLRQIQSQVEILFPKGLTPAQRTEVRKVLFLMQPQQVSNEPAPVNLAAGSPPQHEL